MTRMRQALAAFGIALLTACSESSAPRPLDFLDPHYEVVVESDIVYATGEVRLPAPGEKNLLLDLYRPANAGEPAVRPGIVLVHGGGFSSGSKTSPSVTDMGRRFAELGYVAVSIDHRLLGDDPPTEALATDPTDSLKVVAAAARVDAAAAVEWLRAHAAEYDVDPDRIAIAGYSAGAITALGVAYWDAGPQHAEVRSVFSLSGGLYGSEDMIDADEPSLLLMYGELDPAAGPSQEVANRAEEVGLDYEMFEIPGVDHDTPQALDDTLGSMTVWRTVVNFFLVRLDLVELSAQS